MYRLLTRLGRFRLPVHRMFAKMGFRLHAHVVQVGVDDQGRTLWIKDGQAHFHHKRSRHFAEVGLPSRPRRKAA